MEDQQHREESPENREKQESGKPESAKVELEIVRYRELLETLRQPQMIWRLLITSLFLVIVVFFGLAMVVMSVKKIYPYSTIETNVYGATTMGTEDKDVTYWLFNTAEMWGNSGIQVDKGDIITVRSSGSWHTAIHHLVEQTEKNIEISDKFTGSEGRERRFANDVFRSLFRLVDDMTDGKLLMCIYPDTCIKRSADIQSQLNNRFCNFTENLSDRHIYEIGKERRDFRIIEKGVLHFAVNDIPLTRTNIKKIYSAYVDSLTVAFPEQIPSKGIFDNWINGWNGNDSVTIPEYFRKIDSAITQEWIRRGKPKYSFLFGKRPNSEVSLLNNELIYYYNNNFIDAWYVDNLGSLLIVVEKKKKS